MQDTHIKACLSWPILLLMIASACLLLANIYYSQPILLEMANSIKLPLAAAGMIITAGQLGYIAGLILLAPLGDVVENRKLCALMTVGAGLSALGCALSFNAPILLMFMFLMGAFATATQVLVVLATTLAGSASSGRILGILACGLFAGIAMSRPTASFITGLGGWRIVFLTSGVALIFAGFAMRHWLPLILKESRSFEYLAMLRGMFALFLESPSLVRRTVISSGGFFGFSMFWSAAPIYLAENLRYPQNCITAFTLAGLVTPPCMIIVGKLLDKGYGRMLLPLCLIFVMASWIVVYLRPSWMFAFIAAAIFLDPASSAVTVTVQQNILSSAPIEIKGRLNSLNISCNFLGGATGATLGPWLLNHYGWGSVSLPGTLVAFFLVIFSLTAIKTKNM